MGCDIHVHVEIKINGRWHHYNHPRVERRYSLFGKMAGVRDESMRPISLPKGLPNDITFTTRYDATENWDGGYHSASYLNLEEIKQLKEWWDEQGVVRPLSGHRAWFEDQFGFLFGNSHEGLKEYPKDYPDGLEDVRFVFWFDN